MESHVEQKEVNGLALVAGKKPPRLDPPKDGEETRSTVDEKGRLVFTRMRMAGLANVLTGRLQVPVSDHTGVTAPFDFTLDPNKYLSETPVQSYADRIREAVEDLGLRFEPDKAVQYTLVIDRAERPGEN